MEFIVIGIILIFMLLCAAYVFYSEAYESPCAIWKKNRMKHQKQYCFNCKHRFVNQNQDNKCYLAINEHYDNVTGKTYNHYGYCIHTIGEHKCKWEAANE